MKMKIYKGKGQELALEYFDKRLTIISYLGKPDVSYRVSPSLCATQQFFVEIKKSCTCRVFITHLCHQRVQRVVNNGKGASPSNQFTQEVNS